MLWGFFYHWSAQFEFYGPLKFLSGNGQQTGVLLVFLSFFMDTYTYIYIYIYKDYSSSSFYVMHIFHSLVIGK